MIGAQILTVAHNGIAQASTFQGYILFYFHGTCTMSYFVLLDKTYAVPLTFHALGPNDVIIYGIYRIGVYGIDQNHQQFFHQTILYLCNYFFTSLGKFSSFYTVFLFNVVITPISFFQCLGYTTKRAQITITYVCSVFQILNVNRIISTATSVSIAPELPT